MGSTDLALRRQSMLELTDLLWKKVPQAAEPATVNPLHEARILADVLHFNPPGSHRAGMAAKVIDAAKRAWLSGLRPLHVETMRPQSELNAALVEVLIQLEAQRTSTVRLDTSDSV